MIGYVRFSFGLILFVALRLTLSASVTPVRPVASVADSAEVTALVERFIRLGLQGSIPPGAVDSFAVDSFRDRLLKPGTGSLLWGTATKYSIGAARSVAEGDRIIMVPTTLYGDSVPIFGPLSIDWIFYLRKDDSGKWRISVLRRMEGTDATVETLTYLDTSKAYPPSLKNEIARESVPMLWSNEQLRQHFLSHAAGFDSLYLQFARKDSLKILGRNDNRISQLNTHGIYWGIAAEDVPQDAIDAFMKNATKEERKAMKERIRLAANLRRSGRDTLARFAHDVGLSVRRLDTAIALMKELRITFVNTQLPWKDAVQITVAGKFGNALGYLYSPNGELPLINPNEYFYLEEIGHGWWIFRST